MNPDEKSESQPEQPPTEATPSETPALKPVVSNMNGGNKKKVVILLVLFVLTLLAGLGYYAYTSKKPAPKPAPATTETQKQLNPPKVVLAPYASGFSSPTGIVSTGNTNDKRLFVVERGGIIKAVGENGQVASQPFLDITAKVQAEGEMGLLGLAFSPHYAEDGYFFVNYIDKNQNTVIARYRVSGDDSLADPKSEQMVLTIKQPYPNHNGGDLLFGKDGYLYAALGDGGSGGDPHDFGQNLNSLFGKILRLDVSQLPYKVPVSNPFANQTGKRGEIWAYGLRNPWRVSFDRKTGDLYIADVGQGDREEVNVQPHDSKGGVNYGWRCYEGNKTYNSAGCGAQSNYTFPIFEYDHSDKRCSITGGYIYRGTQYPALDGKYFYGDYCTGELFWAEKHDTQWHSTMIVDTDYQFSTFGEDGTGELYAADFVKGAIYRIQDSAN
jgi:glucose/arabinose dehydrogenase